MRKRETNVGHSKDEPGLRKEKRKIKLRYLRRFLLVFFGLSVAITVVILLLAKIGILPSDHRSSQYLVVAALVLYLALSFLLCVKLCLRRRSARLYFKTALPAYGLVILVSAAMCRFLPALAVWCFLPMRCLHIFGASNPVSYAATHFLMVLVITAAYSCAVCLHAFLKQWRKDASHRHHHHRSHRHHHHHSDGSHSHHHHTSDGSHDHHEHTE